MKLYDQYKVQGTATNYAGQSSQYATRDEFDALRVRVTELEKRLGSVTKMSNAEKQAAYRARKKING